MTIKSLLCLRLLSFILLTIVGVSGLEREAHHRAAGLFVIVSFMLGILSNISSKLRPLRRAFRVGLHHISCSWLVVWKAIEKVLFFRSKVHLLILRGLHRDSHGDLKISVEAAYADGSNVLVLLNVLLSATTSCSTLLTLAIGPTSSLLSTAHFLFAEVHWRSELQILSVAAILNLIHINWLERSRTFICMRSLTVKATLALSSRTHIEVCLSRLLYCILLLYVESLHLTLFVRLVKNDNDLFYEIKFKQAQLNPLKYKLRILE